MSTDFNLETAVAAMADWSKKRYESERDSFLEKAANNPSYAIGQGSDLLVSQAMYEFYEAGRENPERMLSKIGSALRYESSSTSALSNAVDFHTRDAARKVLAGVVRYLSAEQIASVLVS